ncbi:hypothetical protein [Glutamicibacter arilaitensis]|uniref:hypothetical protein n=1 Tax=Glutamicibacter arilaitensis TaxID=256701 RepID=UPI003A8F0758
MPTTGSTPTESELREEWREYQSRILESFDTVQRRARELTVPLAEVLVELFKDDERLGSLHEPLKHYAEADEEFKKLCAEQRAIGKRIVGMHRGADESRGADA